MRKVSLDIDGVLLDFDSAWRRYASQFLGRDVKQLSDTYHMGQRHGLSDSEHRAVWQAFNVDGWETVEPYPDAEIVILRLRELECEIDCITATAGTVERARRESLSKLGLDTADIAFVGAHTDGMTKHDALKASAPDLYVDDQLYNLVAAKESDVENRIWLNRGDEQVNMPEGYIWSEVATHHSETLEIITDLVLQSRLSNDSRHLIA